MKFESKKKDGSSPNINMMPIEIPHPDINPLGSFKEVDQDFEILRIIRDGKFARIFQVRKEKDEMVLKAFHQGVSSYQDFLREKNYNYFLSPHPNIVTSYNVSFIWNKCHSFVQEFAPYGDLSRFVKKGGISEAKVKLIAQQLTSALEFTHGFSLVHRDLKLENILVFRPDLSFIKISDFGNMRREGSLVVKVSLTHLSYSPPEICEVVLQERYYCHKASDVWQVGIILYACLTGFEPWERADITDKSFSQYKKWLRRKTVRMPEQFKPFTPRMTRLFKRLLEPKQSKRSKIREIWKYLNDDWVVKGFHVRLKQALDERRESLSTLKNGSQTQEKRQSVSRSHKSGSYSKGQAVRLLQIYGVEIEEKRSLSDRVQTWVSNYSETSSEE